MEYNIQSIYLFQLFKTGYATVGSIKYFGKMTHNINKMMIFLRY